MFFWSERVVGDGLIASDCIGWPQGDGIPTTDQARQT